MPRSLIALVAVAALGVTSVPALAAAPALAEAPRPTPMLGVGGDQRPMPMADPAVTELPEVGYVAFATGPRVSRFVAGRLGGPWERLSPALPLDEVPAWMREAGGEHSAGTIWAPEIVHDRAFGRDRWLLYYAAVPRPGLRQGNPTHRCISVAVANDPLGDFVTPPSLRRAPLICLPGTPGVIDPSVLQVGRDAYLLYKTRGLPARLRIARLTRDRFDIARGSHRDLVSNPRAVIENPVIEQFGSRFVLFASHGSYRSCAYRTDYWVAGRGLQFRGPARTLLASRGVPTAPAGAVRRTSVCGPGGADVVGPPKRRVLMFHGSLVVRSGRWRPGVSNETDIRTLYGANLTFNRSRDRPVLRSWVLRRPPPRPSAQRFERAQPPVGRARQRPAREPGASRMLPAEPEPTPMPPPAAPEPELPATPVVPGPALLVARPWARPRWA